MRQQDQNDQRTGIPRVWLDRSDVAGGKAKSVHVSSTLVGISVENVD
jgi:hypothetical protein